jgi:hypothetical membrane protein
MIMENDQTKNQLWILVLVCGVLAVPFYFLHDIIGAVNYPGYYWMEQAVSDLTATDAPSFAVASGYVTVYKIFTCICCVCLSMLVRNERKSLRIGIYLFAVMQGISAIGYALFPLTGSGYDGSVQSFIHVYILTALVVSLSIVSLILIAIGSFKGNYRPLGIMAIVALVAMFFGVVGSQNAPKEYFGVFERFSTYSATIFTGVLAVYSFAKLKKN